MQPEANLTPSLLRKNTGCFCMDTRSLDKEKSERWAVCIASTCSERHNKTCSTTTKQIEDRKNKRGPHWARVYAARQSLATCYLAGFPDWCKRAFSVTGTTVSSSCHHSAYLQHIYDDCEKVKVSIKTANRRNVTNNLSSFYSLPKNTCLCQKVCKVFVVPLSSDLKFALEALIFCLIPPLCLHNSVVQNPYSYLDATILHVQTSLKMD